MRRSYKTTRRVPLRDVRRLIGIIDRVIGRGGGRRPPRRSSRGSKYSGGATGNPHPGYYDGYGRWHPYRL